MSKLQMEVAPSHLYLSIRGIQYAFHEAIADLVDNSVDALATSIWIKADKEEILIADNGNGMAEKELETAITPWKAGKKTAKERRGKRGKFGIGLKSASYSLGTILDIHTKQEGSAFEHISLDQDKVAKISNVEHIFETSNSPTSLFKSFCKDNHGTVLQIRNVNKRKVTPQAIESLRNLLGLIYFSLIETGDMEIIVNNERVKGVDPLARGLKKNKPKNRYVLFDKRTIEVESPTGAATFKIQGAYIGRGFYWTDEDKATYKYFLKRNPTEDDKAQKGLVKLDGQGVYTLRNGRLITMGGWLNIGVSANTLIHHNGPVRVLLEFDELGDEFVGLDSAKTQLKIEDHVKDKLVDYISECLNQGEKLFRAEGHDIDSALWKRKASEKVHSLNLRKDSAKTSFKMDERRKKANPGYDTAQDVIEKEDQDEAKDSSALVEVKDRLAHNNLWDYKNNKDEEVLLLLNEQHPGYQALFLEQDIKKVKENVHHLLYTIAMYESSIQDLHAELKPAMLMEIEKLFKTFRKWVSKHYTEF